jgi:hypothetical protein
MKEMMSERDMTGLTKGDFTRRQVFLRQRVLFVHSEKVTQTGRHPLTLVE